MNVSLAHSTRYPRTIEQITNTVLAQKKGKKQLLCSLSSCRPNTAMAAMGSRGDIYKANQTLIGKKTHQLTNVHDMFMFTCHKIHRISMFTFSVSLYHTTMFTFAESSESEDTEVTMKGGRPRSSNSMLVKHRCKKRLFTCITVGLLLFW